MTTTPYDYAFDLPVSELRAVLTALVDRHSLAGVIASLEYVRMGKEADHSKNWQRPGSLLRNAAQVARRNKL